MRIYPLWQQVQRTLHCHALQHRNTLGEGTSKGCRARELWRATGSSTVVPQQNVMSGLSGAEEGRHDTFKTTADVPDVHLLR